MRPEHRLKLGTLVEVDLGIDQAPARLATVMGVWLVCSTSAEKVNVPGQCPQDTPSEVDSGYLLMMMDTGEWARAFYVDETIGYLRAVNMDS